MAQFGYYRVTVFQITQFTVVYHRYDVYFIVSNIFLLDHKNSTPSAHTPPPSKSILDATYKISMYRKAYE